jgi:hypothetical protein
MFWMLFAIAAIVTLALGVFWFRADRPEELPVAESRYDCERCDHRDCECDPVRGESEDEP